MKSFTAKAQANFNFDKGGSGRAPRLRTRHRILIADGDLIFARRLSDYLWDHGFEVRVTKTISEAKELVEFWHPDSVFIDFLLPETNALSLLKFVNSKTLKKKPKVIVMSKQAMPEGIGQMRKAGAAHYLVKPFSLEDAFRAVELKHDRSGDDRQNPDRRDEAGGSLKESPASIKELHLINLFLKQATQEENGGDRLYNLMRMINLKVDGLRTSLVHCLNDQTAVVMASNDDESVHGLPISMSNYPEIAAVRQTGSTVVIPNVRTSDILAKTKITQTPFATMILFPVYRESAFYGVLSVRLAKKDPLEIFYVEKFGQVCSQILSLSIGRVS